MHESSIAQSLIDLIVEQVVTIPDLRVVSVAVRVGELSGVVPEALRSAWQAARARTVADGAALHMESQPVTLWCSRCAAERPARGPQSLRCADCGTPSADVRRGLELELLTLEVSE